MNNQHPQIEQDLASFLYKNSTIIYGEKRHAFLKDFITSSNKHQKIYSTTSTNSRCDNILESLSVTKCIEKCLESTSAITIIEYEKVLENQKELNNFFDLVDTRFSGDHRMAPIIVLCEDPIYIGRLFLDKFQVSYKADSSQDGYLVTRVDRSVTAPGAYL